MRRQQQHLLRLPLKSRTRNKWSTWQTWLQSIDDDSQIMNCYMVARIPWSFDVFYMREAQSHIKVKGQGHIKVKVSSRRCHLKVKGQGHIKVKSQCYFTVRSRSSKSYQGRGQGYSRSFQGQGHLKVKGQGHDRLMPQSHPSHQVHDLVIKNLNSSLWAQNLDSNLDLQTIALNCGPL